MVIREKTRMHIQEAMSYIDATRLAEADELTALAEQDKAGIEHFVRFVIECTNKGYPPASICVYPSYIVKVKTLLQQAAQTTHIATVVNFPYGDQSKEAVILAILNARNCGANEIDMVIPKQLLNKQEPDGALFHYLSACVQAAHPCPVKVILESAELTDSQLHFTTTEAIKTGAAFIKTSTGKSSQGGATPKAAKIICAAIKACREQGLGSAGFKASGGVADMKAMDEYFNIAKEFFPNSLHNPQYFRVGASSLIEKLVAFG